MYPHRQNDRRAMPLVAVLMATYKGERWIKDQILSIVAQREVSVDIHVSDDRSPDRTVATIQELVKSGMPIAITVQSVSSGSAGSNFRQLFRAVDFSRYDYVALADQDDIWVDDHLKTSISMLQSHRAEGSSCTVKTFGVDRVAELRQVAAPRELDFSQQHWLRGFNPCVSSSGTWLNHFTTMIGWSICALE